MLAKRKIIHYSSNIRAKVVFSNFDTDPHWHDDCEILTVLSGSATVLIGDDKFDAMEGDTFFVCSKVPHSIRPDADSKINVLLFDDSAAELTHGKKLSNAKLSKNYDIPTLLESICSELDGKELYFESAVKSAITSLVVNILRNEPHEQCDEVLEEATFGKLLQKIDNCYDFFTFDDAAEYMSLSPVYFSSAFHKFVGTTFSKYINGVRVEKAVELLKKPGVKITDVAMNCGFDTIRNFNYVFRKYTGFAPKQMPSDYRYENRYFVSHEILDTNNVASPPPMILYVTDIAHLFISKCQSSNLLFILNPYITEKTVGKNVGGFFI